MSSRRTGDRPTKWDTARYRHLLLLCPLFPGLPWLSPLVLSISSFIFLRPSPIFMEAMQTDASRATSPFHIRPVLPTLVAMLIYFRYVMGFFMRHFERQAIFTRLSSWGVRVTPSVPWRRLPSSAERSGIYRAGTTLVLQRGSRV